jgi:predicted GIY-YIG superfamily endonuclease
MIYILLLEKDKWYVGYTDRQDGERFKEHFDGNGSKWTQLYKPIQVMEWREGTLADENKVTLEYMNKYGWWNVRGGKYCNIEMTKPPEELIPELPAPINRNKKFITDSSAQNKNDKSKRVCINGRWVTVKNKQINIKSIKKKYNANKSNDECFRCGREGHWETDCYAKTDVNGSDLEDSDDNDY